MRILITGVGSLLAQGIIKSIKKSNINCYLVGTDYFASSVGLYLVDSGYLLPDILNPKVKGKVWIDKLIDIINKEKIDVVIPGLDFEIPILSQKKELIEKSTESTVVVSSKEVVDIGDDKWETVKYLKKNGFNYPKSSLPSNLREFIKSNSFPYIVKPRFGHTSKNVFLVNNKIELEKAVNICDKPIVQEYLVGEDNEYTCSATYVNGNLLTTICLRRILKNGNTQTAFSESTVGLDKYIISVTKSIKPFGAINYQLRETDDGPVIFEINPRFSGTTPIRAIFGVNEVEAVLHAICNEDYDYSYSKIEGVVQRYFENQFISLEKYNKYLL